MTACADTRSKITARAAGPPDPPCSRRATSTSLSPRARDVAHDAARQHLVQEDRQVVFAPRLDKRQAHAQSMRGESPAPRQYRHLNDGEAQGHCHPPWAHVHQSRHDAVQVEPPGQPEQQGHRQQDSQGAGQFHGRSGGRASRSWCPTVSEKAPASTTLRLASAQTRMRASSFGRTAAAASSPPREQPFNDRAVLAPESPRALMQGRAVPGRSKALRSASVSGGRPQCRSEALVAGLVGVDRLSDQQVILERSRPCQLGGQPTGRPGAPPTNSIQSVVGQRAQNATPAARRTRSPGGRASARTSGRAARRP